jgi:hypothetical protein
MNNEQWFLLDQSLSTEMIKVKENSVEIQDRNKFIFLSKKASMRKSANPVPIGGDEKNNLA